jgi:hypothetical protein
MPSSSPSVPNQSSSSSSSNSSSSRSSQSQSQQAGQQQGGQQSSQGGFESSPQVAGQNGADSSSAQGSEGQQAGQQQDGQQSGDGSSSPQVAGNGGFESGTQGGSNGQNSGVFESSGGQGGGDDPFAELEAGRGQVMTAAERRAALDERLNEGFAEFDGMILGERERVQAQADEAGSDVMATGGGGGGSEGDGESGNFEPLVIASGPDGSTGGGIMIGDARREGEFSNQQEETFPVPDDIPPGANDDVVARQLREAAMSEPDPELREALWDEYRAYTGLSTE